MSVDHEYHRRLQSEVLRQALEILQRSEAVAGVAIGGSTARGENDAYSDIDLDCYLTDEARGGLDELIEQVSQVAPLLSRLWVYDRYALYLFENGVRLDLTFYTPGQLAVADLGPSKVLYDPRGLLKPVQDRPPEPRPEPHPRWDPREFEYLDWYFWMFRQVYCWTKRGAAGGRRAFEKLTNAVDSLAQIRNGMLGMRRWLYGSWAYLADVDPGLSSRLSATYPHCEASDILHCTHLLLNEFEALCKPYCEKRGIEYPSRKLRVMRRMLDEFDHVM